MIPGLPALIGSKFYGVKDRCLEFDGIGTHVIAPHITAYDFTTQFSAEAWVKWEADDPERTSGYVVAQSRTDIDGRRWGLHVNINDGRIRLYLSGDGANISIHSTLDLMTFQAGVWSHFAATYNNGAYVLYFNGVAIRSDTSSVTSLANIPQDLYIGARHDGTNVNFDGKIDEVRIWNHARTEAQIKRYMHTRLYGTETGLVAYYPMNEGAFGMVRDMSQNSNHGSIVGAKWIPEYTNRGLEFDASSGSIVDMDTTLIIGDTTWECWVKTSDKTNDRRIFNQQDTRATSGGNGMFALRKISDGTLAFHIRKTGGSAETLTGSDIADGNWHHLAAVRDDDELLLYIDGVLDNSDDGYETVNIDTGNLSVGAYHSQAGVLERWIGLIDEVRIWNTARTQKQIRANMFRELTGNESGLVAYYKLNETSGTTAADSAGNNDGTVTGATWVEY